MDVSGLVYYGIGGCVIFLILALVINLSLNMFIKQFTDRALTNFQERLAQATGKALLAFKEGVCEQMALQGSKTDGLAKLYSALIDLMRDGKAFAASVSKGEPLLSEKTLRTFEEASRSFNEQNRKQSLHFSDAFKSVMEGFAAEQEAVIHLFQTHWQSHSRESLERKQDNEEIRQAWTKFEDRVTAIMELMRNEFRSQVQAPESVMNKWLSDGPTKP
jgi:hypothetical protein